MARETEQKTEVAQMTPTPPAAQPEAPPAAVVVTDRDRLDRAKMARLNRKVWIKGEVILPCLPALLDEISKRLETMFSTLGKPFTADEMTHLRKLLLKELESGFETSALNRVKISWWGDDTNEMAVHYRIQVIQRTKIEQYEYWVKNRKPPLFGAHPDARVMDVAAALTPGARIADLGAGTGRNALPLAKAGFRVEAVDATHSFIDTMRREAAAAGVERRFTAFLGDILKGNDPLPANAYSMVLLSQVLPDMRRIEDMEQVFRRADRLLTTGGVLLFNAFVADDAFELDRQTRELGMYHWCWCVTRKELAAASKPMGFALESDESTFDYEKARQPEWPPTGWFTQWSRGRDLFTLGADEESPITLRWLTYRKPG